MQVRRGSATVHLDWSREGLFDHEVAHLFLSLIQEQKEAKVESVSEKPRSKAPPVALHTVELLRSASSRLHMGPKQAMDVAERLYTEVGCGSPVFVSSCQISPIMFYHRTEWQLFSVNYLMHLVLQVLHLKSI